MLILLLPAFGLSCMLIACYVNVVHDSTKLWSLFVAGYTGYTYYLFCNALNNYLTT